MSPIANLSARRSGVLLHPTSLPGAHGGGDLGPHAHCFAEWLAAAGQTWWQMLPVGPPGWGGSPYDSPSAFAGSPWLVSLEELAKEGLLEDTELSAPSTLARAKHAQHDAAARFRWERLQRAHARFEQQKDGTARRDLARFRADHAGWLRDYCLFSALKEAHGGAHWNTWERGLRRREAAALERAERELRERVRFFEFVQLAFDRQWQALREHCKSLGIALLGDVPMFVAHDGADVWSHPELFFLNRDGEKTAVAGVPPDVFSKTGQLWGNPLFRWKRMQARGFEWWLRRLSVTLSRFDAVRLDHFIGFHRYWQVPADAKTAQDGKFVRVPGEAFFEAAEKHLGGLPFVAEDLGIVTDEVCALRDRFQLPGMRVLQFAFGSDANNDYLPHRHPREAVVYTGTHDNDTIQGWYRGIGKERQRVKAYLGNPGKHIHWDLIRLASMSVANLSLFPLQDVLGLGSEARMNVPGTSKGNWQWRVRESALTPRVAQALDGITRTYGRAFGPARGDAEAFVRSRRR